MCSAKLTASSGRGATSCVRIDVPFASVAFWPMGLQRIARGRPTFSQEARSGSGRWLATASLNMIARFAGERTPARGFFAADPPPAWLVREVERAIVEFPAQCRGIVRHGFDAIPNRNLETGGPAGDGLGHPASDAAAHRLDEVLRSHS